MKELVAIQQELKAPKGQFNNFGKYKYRSCEDILEAVKPLLAKNNAQLTISDDIVEIGGRVYVKATATLTVGSEIESVTAFAREAETKKGMDESQITGMASSYARKYALNGLFLIDDTKDADATNDHGKGNYKKNEITEDPFDKKDGNERDYYLNHPLLKQETKDHILSHQWTQKMKSQLDEKIKELEAEVTF